MSNRAIVALISMVSFGLDGFLPQVSVASEVNFQSEMRGNFIHKEVPVVHHEVPVVHHEVPVVHHEVPVVHHEVPVVHHEVPVVHHKVPVVHHEVPVVHHAPAVTVTNNLNHSPSSVLVAATNHHAMVRPLSLPSAGHILTVGNSPVQEGIITEYRNQAMPATSFTVPSGFASSGGACFYGGAVSNNRPPASRDGGADGAVSVGCGFGNANKIGGSVAYIAEHVGLGHDRHFNDAGSFVANLGHNFRAQKMGVNVRLSNVLPHARHSHRNKRVHWALAVSKLVTLPVNGKRHNLVVNTGMGNGMLAFDPALTANQLANTVKPYVGLSYEVSPSISVVAEDANGLEAAGVSFIPYPKLPCTFNIFQSDIRGKIPDHKGGSLVFSGGCASKLH